MHTALRHLAAAFAYLALSVVFFAPPWPWHAGVYFGYGQDPVEAAWCLNWWPFALMHHLPLLHTAYAEYPAGADLAWTTGIPALGLLAAPFTLHFGAFAVLNVLLVTAPGVAAFAAYLAAWELTRASWPAFAAGLLFGMSGYVIGQGQGHLDLVFCAAVPLAVAVALRAARRGWHWARTGLALGLLGAFEFGTCQEVFCSAVLFGAAALAVLWAMHPPARDALRRLAPGILAGGALCVVLILPLLVPMLRLYGAARGNISPPDSYGNDLLAFITPTPLSFLGGQALLPVSRQFFGNFTEQGGYVSAPLLVLLGVLAWRGGRLARALGVMVLVAMVASLGPYVHVLSVRVSTAPWVFFYRLPLLSAILPCRLMLYAWLPAALLLALGLAEKPDARRWAAVALCLLVLAPSQSFGRNWRVLTPPPVFATLPQDAKVLILPEFGQEMGWQYLSDMRFFLVGQGYVGTGRPAPFRTWPLFEPLWENNFAAIDPRAFAAYLAAYGVQDVVVLADGYQYYQAPVDNAADAAAARALLRAAGWASANNVLFTPAAPPPSAAEIAAYEAQHALPPPVPPAKRVHDIRAETRHVCQLRRLAAVLRLNPEAVVGFYAAHVHLQVPPQSLECPPNE